ncbi:MAG: MarC family protein [bacterium]|jgi:multiple antibiotic resistance protein|nr:MarC family protein [bacterium]MDD3805616.1 MarC family protein [bacterium]MDD4152756.1 MarC family protein [bacterium]MDD4557659.1 MarC family protein [bacterium]
MQLFISQYLKLFFVLTPFFVISMFLALTNEYADSKKKRLAFKVTLAVIVISFSIYLFGKYIFLIFGITLDAFRIGAGALLFLSAAALVQGGTGGKEEQFHAGDIAVVPLALPITVGPATTGVLLVMGAEMESVASKMLAGSALLCAILTVGLLLYAAGHIERWLGRTGLSILSKLTGLILASIAAQIMLTGIKGMLS